MRNWGKRRRLFKTLRLRERIRVLEIAERERESEEL